MIIIFVWTFAKVNYMEPSLVNRIVPISSWLSLRTHELLEIFVSLGACRGGHVSQVGHQVILVERPGDPN